MAWRLALAALALAWFAAADARHSSTTLDPRRATPGLNLELVEAARSATGDAVKYRLRVKGLPEGHAFGVWTKSFGRDFSEVVPALRDDIELDPGPYPRGAAWWVAIASEDQKTTAFARVVPYPIAARDGACSISLELISLYGNRFIALGDGFPAGEEVEIETRASGSVSRKRQRVPPDGRLPLDVVEHGTLSADAIARYMVKARACAPAVEYRWGDSALIKEH
jgi:hypothetical protein